MEKTIRNKIKTGKGELAVKIAMYIVAGVFATLCLYPFFQVFISSFADEVTLVREGYKLIPSKFSLSAWKTLFADKTIVRAYALTIGTTVIGTVLCVLITAMAAYALSGKKLKYRNFFNFIYYLTMLFSGGLTAYYIVVSKYLNLSDNLLVYILPFSFNVWNMFLLRNFFNDIPEEIIESAVLEGAGEWCTAFRIVLPLSLPALATVSLFTAVSFWNEWMTSMLFIHDESYYLLQYIIIEMVDSISNKNVTGAPAGESQQIALTFQLATAIATIGPIVLLYPFLQKYFVAGLRVGGVKG